MSIGNMPSKQPIDKFDIEVALLKRSYHDSGIFRTRHATTTFHGWLIYVKTTNGKIFPLTNSQLSETKFVNLGNVLVAVRATFLRAAYAAFNHNEIKLLL